MDIDRRRNCRKPCNLHRSSAAEVEGCTFQNPAALLSPDRRTGGDDWLDDFGVVAVVAAAAVDVVGVAAAVGGACTVVAAVVESGACSWLNKG